MKIKAFNGEELKVGENGFTLFYKGKEISRDPKMYGDEYAIHAEKIIGSKLKSCLNCKNFVHTPLSIDMAHAFKGRCKFREKEAEQARKSKIKPENYNEMLRTGYYVVSIYFVCNHFEFEAYDISKRTKVIEIVNAVLAGAVEK